MPRIIKTFKERKTTDMRLKMFMAFSVLWFLFFSCIASFSFSIISFLVIASVIVFIEYRKRRYFIYHYEFQGRVLYVEYRKGKQKLKHTIPLEELTIEISSEFSLNRGGYNIDKTIVLRWNSYRIEQVVRDDWSCNAMLFLVKTFYDAIHWDNCNRIK